MHTGSQRVDLELSPLLRLRIAESGTSKTQEEKMPGKERLSCASLSSIPVKTLIWVS